MVTLNGLPLFPSPSIIVTTPIAFNTMNSSVQLQG